MGGSYLKHYKIQNLSPVLQNSVLNYLLELLNQFLKGGKYIIIILNKRHFPKRGMAGCGAIAAEENSQLASL